MNTRIRELAEQAGAYFGGGSTDYFGDYLPPFMSISDLDAEKFAELLVMECVSICIKNQYEGTALYNNGSVSSAEFIKEHFGIDK